MHDDSIRSVWYEEIASDEEKEIYERILGFSVYFSDMIFDVDTSTYQYIVYQNEDDEVHLSEPKVAKPIRLKQFGLFNLRIEIKMLEDDKMGCYNYLDNTLTIDPKNTYDDFVLLHEMIHIHLDVLNECHYYYREIVFYELYRDLSSKIKGLDRAIQEFSQIKNIFSINNSEKGGGRISHDILFLLKSLELDYEMNYEFGTVMGYGFVEKFSYLSKK